MTGRKQNPFRILGTHALLWVVCIAALMPFGWLMSTSLKTLEQTAEFPPKWIPPVLQWHNYKDVWFHEKIDFPLYARNTVIVALLSVLGTVFSSSLVAYGFAKIKFKGRGVLFTLLLGTMMIPFPVLMVATFSIFRWIGDYTPFEMLGTFRPLWLPTFFGSAFNIFLLRQFFITVPDELIEAARIDGCSDFGIYWRVMLPLAKPALITVGLFTFMGTWNDFLGPMIYLQRPEQYTLAIGLNSFIGQVRSDWQLMMAASAMTIAPIVLLYFVGQKAFTEGIATTGMKG